MRNKFILLAMSMLVGAMLCMAAPPDTDTHAVDTIQSRLDHAKVNMHGDVRVSVAEGVATLSGTVDNLRSKLDAEKAAQKTKGVTRVVDNIQVSAPGVSEPQMLAQAYHNVVMYYAYGMFDYVALSAQNGTLVVDGYVTQPFKKVDLERTLQSVKGVAAIQNNLKVLPLSNIDDRLRMQLARAIYGNSNFMPYRDLALPPIHIIVDNGNVILDGVVNNNMDRNMAGIIARGTGLSFSVTNNLQVARPRTSA